MHFLVLHCIWRHFFHTLRQLHVWANIIYERLHVIIKTLQVRPSDLDRYQLPPQCRLEMTEHDKKMGEELLKEPFIQKHPEWIKELEIMMKSGEKAEIQVLAHCVNSLSFASSSFLCSFLVEYVCIYVWSYI